ncbi:thymidylate synthase [Synechococcus phage DSL-LC07]|nr:thymidylate synthase [Synechococcus phage DSL-LC07]
MTHSTKLVHITPNAEELISYMARVSNPANQNNTETSAKLIKYLIDHHHWSPFEMVNMCVEIETTRSIAAQILRHRSFSFQEFSQRYAQVTDVAQIPELRRQDTKNRQNSINDLEEDKKKFFDAKIGHLYSECYRVYQDLLDAGVAKECAREVLPMSAPTKLYMNGTIRSWLHYCDLRTSNGTQKEHALIAAQIQDILYSQLPNVSQAMWDMDYNI